MICFTQLLFFFLKEKKENGYKVGWGGWEKGKRERGGGGGGGGEGEGERERGRERAQRRRSRGAERGLTLKHI